jgi:hypothetical protein
MFSNRRGDLLGVPSRGDDRVTSGERRLGNVDAQAAAGAGDQPNLLVAHAAARPSAVGGRLISVYTTGTRNHPTASETTRETCGPLRSARAVSPQPGSADQRNRSRAQGRGAGCLHAHPLSADVRIDVPSSAALAVLMADVSG